MKNYAKRLLPAVIYNLLKSILFSGIFTYQYIRIRRHFKRSGRFSFLWRDRLPKLYDNSPRTNFDRHYIYHPAWAARAVKKINPKKHIDVSSSLSFGSIVSAFVPVEFYDYRPVDLHLSSFESKKGDLTSLPFDNNSIESLSCMHTVEHVGLGRYGDPIDPDGDMKAMNELKRVVSIGGSLLFVVPLGKRPKIQFNAHRIYSYDQIMDYFSNLKLVEFSLIPEYSGTMIYNASKSDVDKEEYACGCFWFTK